jgi:hypothetical protein
MTMQSATQQRILPESAYAIGLPIALGAAVLVAWQLGVKLAGISPVILPAPSDIAFAFNGIGGELLRQGWATGSEAFLAFFLSCAFGLAAAFLLSSSAVAFEMFYPNLVVFQIIPKIALAPLFTFWLGIEAPSRLSYARRRQCAAALPRRGRQPLADILLGAGALFAALFLQRRQDRGYDVGHRHRHRRVHLRQ